MTLHELVEDFEWLDSDMVRLKYILDLGKDLDPFPADQKNDDNAVSGCTSNAWLIHKLVSENPPRLRYFVEADAHIVKGLAAILLVALNDKSPSEILEFDVSALFERLKLRKHLTPGRQNGLLSMANKMKAIAKSVAQA
jgi:cysteine desulfuration protein SufE